MAGELCSPLSCWTSDYSEAANVAGLPRTPVITAPPQAGFTDLFVYQPNKVPVPELYISDQRGYRSSLKYFLKNFFILPPSFQPISGVSGLVIAVRRACPSGKDGKPTLKLRQLRIMGHGLSDFAFIGSEQVWADLLVDPSTGRPTTMGKELAQIKEYLDPDVSLVVMDHCFVGRDARFMKVLSRLLGGVRVRGYTGLQTWQTDKIQVGEGIFRECKGDVCHEGVEQLEMSERKKTSDDSATPSQ